jgi:signal transduction histidine kinase
MNKLLKVCTLVVFMSIVNSSWAQALPDGIQYQSLDTSQIRIKLSRPIGFFEENLDTLAREFQFLYSRSNSLHFWWGRMKASSLLGVTYELSGNSELSMMCFTRAIAIANERKEFNPFLPDIYTTLTGIYQTREDYAKTLDLLEKCEHYVNFHKSSILPTQFNAWRLDIYTMRSRAFAGLNRISDADKALEAARQAVSEHGELSLEQSKKINLARFYINDKLHRYKECEKLIFKNLAITQKMDGHNRGRFTSAPIMTSLYVKMGQYDKAYKYADSARQARLYDMYIQWQLHLHKTMVKADSATGDVKGLINRYKIMQALNDTLNKRNRHSSAAYYQTELDIQTHINALRQKEEESKGKSVIIIMAVVIGLSVSILLSVIVFLIWRNNKKTRRNVLELSRLNDEIKSKHSDIMVAFSSLEQSHEENKHLIKVVAHDLRNPLISNISALAFMADQMEVKPAVGRAMDTIKTNTANSLSLIDDLLHDKGQLQQTTIEMVELHSVLQYCVNLLKERATEKDQKIELKTEPVSLLIDREKIWRVMSNLIFNAIKFSPVGAIISVQTRREKDKVLTIIRDNGIGIPESFKKGIFDMFTSSQRKGTNGEESFGIGLAVSKGIIEAHKGRIWFESIEDIGTTFFVELPVHELE